MTIEGQTIAVFPCGYREEAPSDPENITIEDPNGVLYRSGDFGHDFTYMKQDCPCGDHDCSYAVYPYAEQAFRILIKK